MYRALAATASTVLLLVLGQPAAAMAPAKAVMAPAKPGCTKPETVYTKAPAWAQTVVDASPVWSLTRGGGVRVAILSTGMDVRNAQLPPQAMDGATDVIESGLPATADCDGRGTFLAGLVAARRSSVTTFAGVAPDVRVIPIRVTQTVSGEDGDLSVVGGTATDLAAGIRQAVREQASVICVPMQVPKDDARLKKAVAAATKAGALVVAGGPYLQDTEADEGDRPFPQMYPEVLAVTSVNEDGGAYAPARRFPGRQVAAPGNALVSTSPVAENGDVGHFAPRADPAGAVALVAGVAALVRAYHPEFSARQVADRIVDTANPLAVVVDGELLPGLGMVDVVQAVTAVEPVPVRSGVFVAPAPAVLPPPAPPSVGPRAVAVAGTLTGITVAAVFVALTVRGARRRARPPVTGTAR